MPQDTTYAQILNLDQYNIFLEEELDNSKYIFIDKLPKILSYGKHYFLLSWKNNLSSPYQLKTGSKILFELKDSEGNIIFSDITNTLPVNGSAVCYVWLKKNSLRLPGDRWEITDGPCILSVVYELEGSDISHNELRYGRSTFQYEVKKKLPNTSSILFHSSSQLGPGIATASANDIFDLSGSRTGSFTINVPGSVGGTGTDITVKFVDSASHNWGTGTDVPDKNVYVLQDLTTTASLRTIDATTAYHLLIAINGEPINGSSINGTISPNPVKYGTNVTESALGSNSDGIQGISASVGTSEWDIQTMAIGKSSGSGHFNNLIYSRQIPGHGFVTSSNLDGENNIPEGVFFHPSGSKMFFVGREINQGTVYEYSLSTNWDIELSASMTYTTESRIHAEEMTPRDIHFKPDGKKMFIVGDTSPESVYEYALSTPWSIAETSSMTFTTSSAVNNEDSSPQAIFFHPSGSKMFMAGNQNDTIFEYSLSTPWDVSSSGSMVYVTGSSYENETSVVHSMFFNSSGSKMFLGTQEETILEYSLTTPWDVTSMLFVQSGSIQDITGTTQSPDGLFFHPSGSKMFVVRGNTTNTSKIHYFSGSLTSPKITVNVDDKGIDGNTIVIKNVDDSIWSSSINFSGGEGPIGLKISESLEFDNDKLSPYKRSILHISTSNMRTDGGKVEFIEFSYRESSSAAASKPFQSLTTYRLSSSNEYYEVTSSDAIGLNPLSHVHKVVTPKEIRRNQKVDFKLRFLNTNKEPAQNISDNTDITVTSSLFITGSPFILEESDNLVHASGSLGFGNNLDDSIRIQYIEEVGDSNKFSKRLAFREFTGSAFNKEFGRMDAFKEEFIFGDVSKNKLIDSNKSAILGGSLNGVTGSQHSSIIASTESEIISSSHSSIIGGKTCKIIRLNDPGSTVNAGNLIIGSNSSQITGSAGIGTGIVLKNSILGGGGNHIYHGLENVIIGGSGNEILSSSGLPEDDPGGAQILTPQYNVILGGTYGYITHGAQYSSILGSYGLALGEDSGNIIGTGSAAVLGGCIIACGNNNNVHHSYSTIIGMSDKTTTAVNTVYVQNLDVDGTLTAQEFHTNVTSASIIYASGSTKFGDTIDDVHNITGSLRISGSVFQTGSTFNIGSHIGDNPGDGISALNVSGSISASGGLQVNRFKAGENVAGAMDGLAVDGHISSSGKLYIDDSGVGTAESLTIRNRGSISANGIAYLSSSAIGPIGTTTTSSAYLTVAGDISASGAYYGKQFYYTHHICDFSSAAAKYIPINAAVEGFYSYVTRWIAPFDGELKKVILYTTSDPDSTVTTFYKNGSAQDTDIVDMDTTTTATFNFSSSFDAGDLLSINLDPTNNPDNCNITCVWLYDTST